MIILFSCKVLPLITLLGSRMRETATWVQASAVFWEQKRILSGAEKVQFALMAINLKALKALLLACVRKTTICGKKFLPLLAWCFGKFFSDCETLFQYGISD